MSEATILYLLAKYGIDNILFIKTTDLVFYYALQCRYFYDATNKAFLIVDRNNYPGEITTYHAGTIQGGRLPSVTVLEYEQIEEMEFKIPRTELDAMYQNATFDGTYNF